MALLPKHVRAHIQAVYAYAHAAQAIQQKGAKPFEALKQQTQAAFDDGHSQVPYVFALSHTLRQFDVPAKHLFSYLDGLEKEGTTSRYESYRALQNAIDQTSGLLGKMSAEILVGRRQKSLFPTGQSLPRADRLLNMLLNVRQDYEKNEAIYLPQRDLKKFGYKVKQLRDNEINDAWRELAEAYLKKIEAHISKAGQELKLYPASVQPALQAAALRLEQQVKKIRHKDYNVFGRTPTLSWWDEQRLIWPLYLQKRWQSVQQLPESI